MLSGEPRVIRKHPGGACRRRTHITEPAQSRRRAGAARASGTRCWTPSSITARCAAFLPRALPEGTLELLVAAAQSASTSSNLQFWSVVAVQEPERKSRLAELAGQQQFIRDAPLLLVWLADLSRLDRIAAEHQAQVDGTHYLEEFIVGVVDAALAAQSALIAAESLGLGGVYIGAMRNLPEQIAAELALPPHVFAVFGMSIGYPDPARSTDIKPRLPQSVVLHREQYSVAARSDAIDDYNATMRGFQREQG